MCDHDYTGFSMDESIGKPHAARSLGFLNNSCQSEVVAHYQKLFDLMVAEMERQFGPLGGFTDLGIVAIDPPRPEYKESIFCQTS